jgi:CcmD family protein
MIKLVASFWMILTGSLSAFAQEPQPEMADAMRAEGKIYVVVAIVLVIFIGLIAYLVTIDRKVSRLEKKIGRKA